MAVLPSRHFQLKWGFVNFLLLRLASFIRIVTEGPYREIHPSPTHLTAPFANFTFDNVRGPPCLKMTCVIPTLSTSSPFQAHCLTTLAPKLFNNSANGAPASSPSAVLTSTKAMTPCNGPLTSLSFRVGLTEEFAVGGFDIATVVS